ncbi:MAG: hypothetical protein R6W70_00015, partial [bacterium]
MYRFFTITTILFFIFIFPSCEKNSNGNLKKDPDKIRKKSFAKAYKQKITMKDISRFSHKKDKNTENEVLENKNPGIKKPQPKKQSKN